MDQSKPKKLGDYLNQVIHWRWEEFCEEERKGNHSSSAGVVLSLIRIASEGKLPAIKLALDRVDGKIATPIQVVYPKVYFRYPYAKTQAALEPGQERPKLDQAKATTSEVGQPVNIATASLRETLKAMADAPKQLPKLILQKKKEVEAGESASDPDFPSPQVKSVLVANFLELANNKKDLYAIYELFDQIDGKLTETIEVMGDDIYITQFDTVAPAMAVEGDDGVYLLENQVATQHWEDSFRKERDD